MSDLKVGDPVEVLDCSGIQLENIGKLGIIIAMEDRDTILIRLGAFMALKTPGLYCKIDSIPTTWLHHTSLRKIKPPKEKLGNWDVIENETGWSPKVPVYGD